MKLDKKIKYKRNLIKTFDFITNIGVLILVINLITNWNKYNLWVVILIVLVIAGYRIYRGWYMFDMVTKIGADQLRLMKKARGKK